jgi:hypothetical protein
MVEKWGYRIDATVVSKYNHGDTDFSEGSDFYKTLISGYGIQMQTNELLLHLLLPVSEVKMPVITLEEASRLDNSKFCKLDLLRRKLDIGTLPLCNKEIRKVVADYIVFFNMCTTWGGDHNKLFSL